MEAGFDAIYSYITCIAANLPPPSMYVLTFLYKTQCILLFLAHFLQCVIPPSESRPWNSLVRDMYSYGEVPSATDSRLIVDLRWFGMIEPRYENCVTFSDDPTNTDLFGMPQPTFHYSLAEDDSKRLQLMMDDMCKCAGVLGKYLPGREPKVLPPGSAHHITVSTPSV